MFDFPANPAIGDASNGYVFNGVGWAGGPIAGTPTEQFFDLAGLVTKDVPVPTWAKGVEIIASIIPVASQQLALRMSGDGTTFASGASDYATENGWHVQLPTPLWSGNANTAKNMIELGLQGSNINAPHQIDAFVTVERKAGDVFVARAYSKTLDTTSGIISAWCYGYANTTATSALRLAALRFLLTGGGAFGVGSWVKLKWHGASADIPQSNAPGEAPQTGGEYVRVNGIWRLKSQTLVLDGATQVGVPVAVPTNARAVKFSGSINIGNNAASLSASMRWSVDGTTFPAGAADYSYSGSYFGSVAGPAALPSATASYALMTISSASANCPVKFDGSLQLSRTGTQLLLGKCYSTSLQSGNHYQGLIQFWAAGAAFNPPTVLKALSFGAHGNAVTLAADSYVDLEWVY